MYGIKQLGFWFYNKKERKMYNEEDEVKKTKRKLKIIDISFLFILILWSIVWILKIWFTLISSSINPFVGVFVASLILFIGDFLIANFFLWLSRKTGRIKR